MYGICPRGLPSCPQRLRGLGSSSTRSTSLVAASSAPYCVCSWLMISLPPPSFSAVVSSKRRSDNFGETYQVIVYWFYGGGVDRIGRSSG